jgi:hypothetical protein
MHAMPAGLPIAFLLLAQAATAAPGYGPSAPDPPKATAAPAGDSGRDCMAQNKDPNAKQIVICAPKPQGYRLPPDIVEARRLKKQGETVGPKNPHETFADHSCATVGPMGCRGTPAINLVAVAAVAAEMSARMAKGQEVGSMFETTPTSSEYQYYLEAKKRREEKEAQAAAAKVKAAAEAKQATRAPAASQ